MWVAVQWLLKLLILHICVLAAVASDLQLWARSEGAALGFCVLAFRSHRSCCFTSTMRSCSEHHAGLSTSCAETAWFIVQSVLRRLLDGCFDTLQVAFEVLEQRGCMLQGFSSCVSTQPRVYRFNKQLEQ